VLIHIVWFKEKTELAVYIFIAIFFYIIDCFLLISYVIHKYQTRRYIFSLFNLGLFTYSFILLVAGWTAFNDSAWSAFGSGTINGMHDYIWNCFAINLVSYFFFLLTLRHFEFKPSSKARMLELAQRASNNLNSFIVDALFIAVYLTFVSLCLIYNKGTFPLFNGGRNFFYMTSISPLYLATTGCINLAITYYGIRVIQAKRGFRIRMVLAIAFSLMTGTRAGVLSACVILAIYWMYLHINPKKWGKIFFRSIIVIAIAAVGALFLAQARTAQFETFSIDKAAQEVFNGNTFSDVRDGAYVLYGFDRNWNNELLFGKTYAAAIISFIPSSQSEFRQMYSIGRFTTLTLFGYTNHFGLRGGQAMEAYLNFGWIAVIIVGIAQGAFLAVLERTFYVGFLQKRTVTGKAYLFIALFASFYSNVLVNTASFYSVYVYALFLLVAIVFSSPIAVQRNNADCNNSRSPLNMH
jgi:hypothetical protein